MSERGNDTTVTCEECGREGRMDFAVGLTKGWPVCCDVSMRVTPDDAKTVEKACGRAWAPIGRLVR